MSPNQKNSSKSRSGGAKGSSDGRRIQRVEKEIREVIGQFLIRGFRGELPGIVSASRVIVSRDLRTAKVLVTLMVPATVSNPTAEDEKAQQLVHKQTVETLQENAHEFQAELNRCLKMKHCPRITFFYDDGFEHALRIEGILRDLKIKSGQEQPRPEFDGDDDDLLGDSDGDSDGDDQ